METQWHRSGNVISTPMDDGLALLDLTQGQYYSFNETAKDIWALLEQPRTVSAIVDALQASYAVERDECEAAVVELIDELAADSMIERAP
jgi:hypothetical protein